MISRISHATPWRRSLTLGSCLGCLLLGGFAWADGGILLSTRDVYVTDQKTAVEQGLLSSDGQRGVLWHDAAGQWELCIDPGRSAVDNAAWILPLPTLPTVSEVDVAFFDQLDAATTPVLETTTITTTITTVYDYDYGGDGFFGCGCGSADMATEKATGSKESESESNSTASAPPVTVWGSGSLGVIQYELISAISADALVDWLTTNEYVVPEGLAPIAETYIKSGSYFFAAKFQRSVQAQDARRAEPIPAVCFGLGDKVSPSYPMRLTKLSVKSSLSFTLWFVDAQSNAFFYRPDNFDFRSIGDFGETEATLPFPVLYQARLDSITLADALAIQFTGEIANNDLVARVGKLGSGTAFPLSSEREQWHPRFKELVDAGYAVQRFYGKLPIAKMDDISFVEQPRLEELLERGFHQRIVRTTEQRSEYGSVAPVPASGRRAMFGLLVLLVGPLALFRRRAPRR